MVADDIYNEKLLLNQVAASSEPAFKKLYDLYKSKLYTFAFKFTHSEEDAEEIVQETFFTIWKNRHSLLAVEQPANYIYTIARNKTYDFMAKAAKDERLLSLIWANMQHFHNRTEDLLAAAESNMLITQAIQKLPEQKQKIFRMSRYEEMSHEDIATATGLSKSRVKNIIVEILKYLRGHLQENFMLTAFVCSLIEQLNN